VWIPLTDVYAAASWLMSHGFPYDADLDQDPDRYGVSLLFAYGLDLDPHLDPTSRMPSAMLDPDDCCKSALLSAVSRFRKP
jgi:hypothetical protein